MNQRLITFTSMLLLAALLAVGLSHPMLYKRKENDKYEPDLVAISSTVIPLSVYEVSYGLGGKPSEEYKIAYLKKLRKKVKHEDDDSEDPDTLITVKSKHHIQKKEKEAHVKGA